MLNRLIHILILMVLCLPCSAQMIESQSRPYRFDITPYLTLEGVSESGEYTIVPFKQRIEEKLEAQMLSWFENFGYKYQQEENFEEIVREEIRKIQPLIINSVGNEVMSKSNPELFFIPEELKFEIHFKGFEAIEVEVPIADVEAFRENFYRLKYSDQSITYNEFDQFVITEVNIYDPVSDAIYSYVRYGAENIITPNFYVELPVSE